MNFSDFAAKSCSPKKAPKTYRRTDRKTHRKTECFHQNLPTNYSPNFPCVFFCSKNSKCHRKTASKKFSQKIHHGTEQNPECRCGRGGSLSTCPFEKQTLSRKNLNFLQLAVLHLSSFQDLSYTNVQKPYFVVFLETPTCHLKPVAQVVAMKLGKRGLDDDLVELVTFCPHVFRLVG